MAVQASCSSDAGGALVFEMLVGLGFEGSGFRGYRVYRVYRVYKVYRACRVYRVYRVYRFRV